jgi:hypothetical protein
VTRAKPAKNYSALVLIESTMGFSTIPATARSDVKTKKSFIVAIVGREKRERDGEEVGKHALLIKLQAWRNGLPRSSICLSDP